ncbi:LysE/ArgO family amino acid transporter [Neisseria musculi]|uniref:LysE type translocator family protein n=1 Tax=Neisseria musculi TaxID=1815583 RepID=A0A7H1M9N9_9NEIS|nr:LysE family transporter [Neisseria musculi]QNT58354.1 lysE type translocator family protein [Neisseria musculi]
MQPFFTGLMITGGLIAAIGAQNAFVLKQGLLKQHIGLVVLLCWLCDVVLIALGIFGTAALLAGNPAASALLALAGSLFLLAYGAINAKRAWQGGGHLAVNTDAAAASSLKTATTTLALTLLNPHVYIDTVVLIGGAASSFNQTGKMLFLLGSLTASACWFVSIGFGARLLLPLFRRERVWQVLEGLIALMMFYLAWNLLQQALALLF